MTLIYRNKPTIVKAIRIVSPGERTTSEYLDWIATVVDDMKAIRPIPGGYKIVRSGQQCWFGDWLVEYVGGTLTAMSDREFRSRFFTEPNVDGLIHKARGIMADTEALKSPYGPKMNIRGVSVDDAYDVARAFLEQNGVL